MLSEYCQLASQDSNFDYSDGNSILCVSSLCLKAHLQISNHNVTLYYYPLAKTSDRLEVGHELIKFMFLLPF